VIACFTPAALNADPLGEARAKAPPSKRVWADDVPAVALAEFVGFVAVDWAGGALQELLDVAAAGGRGVEKQDAAGFAAGVSMHAGRCAGRTRTCRPADGNLVADLKGDLAGEHPGDLVAVAVYMEEALGADRYGFLEQHAALIGLVAEELKAAERPGVVMSRCFPPPANTTKPFVAVMLVSFPMAE
jgi:hypothetical protein